jgi:hypothetical protein
MVLDQDFNEMFGLPSLVGNGYRDVSSVSKTTSTVSSTLAMLQQYVLHFVNFPLKSEKGA